MVTGLIDEVANRMKSTVDQGFEVYIYSIEPSPSGPSQFFPPNVLTLRRVYHLYDARDKYRDEAHSIVESLSEHSQEASAEYLNIMISEFQRELDLLKEEQNAEGNIPEPQTDPGPTEGNS
jgi:hypothetical protein